MNAKYVVASKKNRTVRTFNNASEVATFMWVRDFLDWCIYQRQDGLPCDIKSCEDVLVAREKLCHSGEPVIGMGGPVPK
jgi:hypothetical protein